MDSERRFELITRGLEEVLTPEDLRHALETGIKLKHYIGFEISGRLHIGSAFMAMRKIKDYMDAGVQTSIFLADWHTWINNKLGGDLEVIRGVATQYFIESFKTTFKSIGGDPEKLNFVKGFELYHHNDDYWETVIDIAKHTTLSRMLRSITIAGRKEGESVPFALLIYPAMQVADIFIQGVNLPHAGIDQRKAHVIARDVGLKIKNCLRHDKEVYKPIALHHPLVPGLKIPEGIDITKISKDQLSAFKMSKSIPNSAIFLNDSREEVEKKIMGAYCPAKETYYNPVLEWARLLVFPVKSVLEVIRPEKYGGNKIYESFDDLKKDFETGNLHPLDLKKAVISAINDMLEPIRKDFDKNLLENMKKIVG